MPKRSAKEIARKIKEKETESQKSNFTFRLKNSPMSDFKVKCGKLNISMSAALEEMITDFNGGKEK